MTNQRIHTGIFAFFIVLMTVLIFLFLHLSKHGVEPLRRAQNFYEQGVQAIQVYDRNQAFNNALNVYIDLEKNYAPIHGNGKFYNNMAQLYSLLDQDPWVILYFNQAKSLLPRDPEIAAALNQALQKMQLPPENDKTVFKQIFFFHNYLSLPERLQILAFLTVLLAILISVYIWKNHVILKGFTILISILWIIFLLSISYTKYVQPLNGIVVQSSMLYRDKNMQTAYVSPKPLLPGSKVEILDALNEGLWLKIRTSDNLYGYIPSSSVRLIKI